MPINKEDKKAGANPEDKKKAEKPADDPRIAELDAKLAEALDKSSAFETQLGEANEKVIAAEQAAADAVKAKELAEKQRGEALTAGEQWKADALKAQEDLAKQTAEVGKLTNQAIIDKEAYEKLETELDDANALLTAVTPGAPATDESAAMANLKKQLKAAQADAKKQRSLRIKASNEADSLHGNVSKG